jgi:ABC-2 type transport system permease protein
VLVTLYVLTNVWELIGPLGLVRFLSPFHWANASRPLVPGEGLDVAATVALAVMTWVLIWLAAEAFDRRDYGGVLWARPRRERVTGPVRVQRCMLGSVWRSQLLRARAGMVWWTLSGAAFAGLVALLEPTVMEAWEAFESYMGTAATGVAPEAQYLSFAGEVTMPFVAAYVLAQASGWVTDLAQGRVEAVLSAPVSWTRLVLERVLATVIGVTVFTAGTLGGLAAAATAVGVRLDPAGMARLALDCVLLGAALAGVAALVVASLRSGLAVTVLAAFVGVSYVVSLLAPMLDWPEWAGRLSFFTAFGHPYLGWPAWGGTLILVFAGFLGTAGAAAIASHTPKVS